MVKKLFFILVTIMFLTAFTMTVNTPLMAQEEEKVEDVMDISLEDLLDVEITTAGKKAEKVSEIPASIVVITRDDIERYGYTSLREILENVPGVYALDDMSYYGTSFGMRGFYSQGPRNVIFMVNNIHQKDGFWQTSAIRNFSIPVEAIDRIEVVRGPMSVVYGSGAFFGAINIITDQVEENKAVNIVSVSGGSTKTVKAAARFSGLIGDLKYAFTGGYYNTEGPDVPLSTMTSMTEYLPLYGIDSTNDTTAKRLEDDNKYFNMSLNYKGLYTKLSLSESNEEDYVVVPSVSNGSLVSTTHNLVSIGYRKDISDKFTLDTSFTYHRNEWWSKFDLFDPSFYSYEHGRSSEYELDFTTIFSPSDKVNITTGLHYQKIDMYDSFDLIPSFPYNVVYVLPDAIIVPSIFSQLDFKLGNSVRFVLGGRLERVEKYTLQGYSLEGDGVELPIVEGTYDNNEIKFIPRVAAIFSLNSKNIVKFLYGRAIRHPEFQPNIENLIYGAPTVVPEFIDTFEFNYIGSLSPQFTLNFSAFYNKLQDLIERKIEFIGGSFVSVYGNGGQLQTIGAELSIIAQPFKNFILDLSGTYQKSETKTAGLEDLDVAYSPKLLGHFKASYRAGLVTVGLTGRYIDKMVPLYDVGSEARIGQEVDSHFIMDGNLRIDNIFSNFFISVRVTNMFDTEYLYPTNINNNLWADLGVIGRGLARSFLVTIGKKF